MDRRQSLQPRLRTSRCSLPRQNRRRHAIPREGHPGRRRIGVHGRVRGRLSDKGNRSLRPAAAKPANERRRRTLQRRLAIRVLRNLRPPVRRRTTQPHPRQLSAPLQPSSTPRSPCRKNPSPVSRSPISQDTHTVPYVLSPDIRLIAPAGRGNLRHGLVNINQPGRGHAANVGLNEPESKGAFNNVRWVWFSYWLALIFGCIVWFAYNQPATSP